MRYGRFEFEGGPRYVNVEVRGGVEWVVSARTPPEEDLPALRVHEEHPPQAVKVEALTEFMKEHAMLAPVCPSKIVCVGRNYKDHAAELGNDVPAEPLLFLKPPSALLAPGGTVWMPAMSKRVDFEGELAVVIGKRCARLAEGAEARKYIRGYTCLNDATMRDLQKSDPQWTRGKGFDTSCPVGPLVTDEIDPIGGNVSLTTRVNGAVKQQGETNDFIFGIEHLLRYISAVMTLEVGDVVATGTPAGVAGVNAGDVVEVEVAGVGVLRNVFGEKSAG